MKYLSICACSRVNSSASSLMHAAGNEHLVPILLADTWQPLDKGSALGNKAGPTWWAATRRPAPETTVRLNGISMLYTLGTHPWKGLA